MQNFNLFKIEDSLKDSINRMKFKEPTPNSKSGNSSSIRRQRYIGNSTNWNWQNFSF